MILWLLLKLDQKHFTLYLIKCHESWPCLQPSPHLLPPLYTSLSYLNNLNPDPWICQRPYFILGWQDEEGEQFCFTVAKCLKKPYLNLVLNLKFHFLVLCLISNCIYVSLWYYCFLKVRIMVFLFLLTP